MRWTRTIGLTLTAALAVVALTGTPAAAATTTEANLVYSSSPTVCSGQQCQKLDVHYTTRAPARARPAVIFVHGGGWTGGQRSKWTNEARQLAQSTGWLTVNISYDIVGPGLWSQQPADVAAAVAWVRNKASTYKVDVNRIVLIGESSGAHLAAGYGWTRSGIKALVLFSGVYDLPAALQSQGCADRLCQSSSDQSSRVMSYAIQRMEDGCVPQSGVTSPPVCPARYDATSPARAITATVPMTWIVHAAQDPVVPYTEAVRTEQALLAKGARYSSYRESGYCHGKSCWAASWPQIASAVKAYVAG